MTNQKYDVIYQWICGCTNCRQVISCYTTEDLKRKKSFHLQQHGKDRFRDVIKSKKKKQRSSNNKKHY